MLSALLIIMAILILGDVSTCTTTYLRLKCRWRLRFGFCPNCYSSPPDVNCFVCHGSRDYGPNLTDLDKARWRFTYESQL